MPSLPTLSVIIPTYNRKVLLREALKSLTRQTYPQDRIEVIVVDDGSTDGTAGIAAEAFSFSLRYFSQSNQGDAAARNLGARQSQADILVFLDDDILLEPGYLLFLIQAHDTRRNRIVVGTWNFWQAESTPLSKTLNTTLAPAAYVTPVQFEPGAGQPLYDTQPVVELPFRDVYSNNMSLWREAYFEIGMMQGLDYRGSSMWCDLDFSYRGYQQGFEFFRSTKAICWHRDHAARSLEDYKQRVSTAAYRAVVLFQKYPDLQAHLPMFYDKSPVVWGQDPPQLIARKFARAMASTRPALWSMEQLVNALEKNFPAATILPPLYRYIIGGYVFQGFRAGLCAGSGN
jgi:glycosyltransferase involved in cell wall biosynthesis